MKANKKLAIKNIYRIFVRLVLHPRSNGTVIVFDMDSVRLIVQTVPASDPETREIHIAYTVLRKDTSEELVAFAPGWTLKDAIENYCKWFQTDRCQVKLIRPFRPQGWEENGNRE